MAISEKITNYFNFDCVNNLLEPVLNSWYGKKAKEIAPVALSALALYHPLEQPILLGFNAAWIVSSMDEMVEAHAKEKKTALAIATISCALGTVAIATLLFTHTFGVAITEGGTLINELREGHLSEATKAVLSIASILSGSLLAVISYQVINIALKNIKGMGAVVHERNFEAAGYFSLAGVLTVRLALQLKSLLL